MIPEKFRDFPQFPKFLHISYYRIFLNPYAKLMSIFPSHLTQYNKHLTMKQSMDKSTEINIFTDW
jgi:hypothetical protein